MRVVTDVIVGNRPDARKVLAIDERLAPSRAAIKSSNFPAAAKCNHTYSSDARKVMATEKLLASSRAAIKSSNFPAATKCNHT